MYSKRSPLNIEEGESLLNKILKYNKLYILQIILIFVFVSYTLFEDSPIGIIVVLSLIIFYLKFSDKSSDALKKIFFIIMSISIILEMHSIFYLLGLVKYHSVISQLLSSIGVDYFFVAIIGAFFALDESRVIEILHNYKLTILKIISIITNIVIIGLFISFIVAISYIHNFGLYLTDSYLLEDKEFYIVSYSEDTKALTEIERGRPIEVDDLDYSGTRGDSQIFHVTKNEESDLFTIMTHSGNIFDVVNNEYFEGNVVIARESNGNQWQEWLLSVDENGVAELWLFKYDMYGLTYVLDEEEGEYTTVITTKENDVKRYYRLIDKKVVEMPFIGWLICRNSVIMLIIDVILMAILFFAINLKNKEFRLFGGIK